MPRLLVAHRMDGPVLQRISDARPPPTPEEIQELVNAVSVQDVSAGIQQAESLLQQGLSLESVLIDWIAEAARVLGEQWLSDDKSFAEVTLGMNMLYRISALLRHRLKPPPPHRGQVVLLAAPGEQHTLGIHILGDLLQHAGWDAVVEPHLSEDELVAMVSTEPVVMVGITVSSEQFTGSLGRIVKRVRKASLNRDVGVLLGGAVDLSEQAEAIGAVFCPSVQSVVPWLNSHARISI
ncbi:MAG: cobalamin-dependent protein [Myxococcota bacterium]